MVSTLPFPYIGNKNYLAPLVWQILGDPAIFCDPFFGSMSILLLRPNYDPHRHVEIVGDLNGFVVNFYRAVRAEPEKVAEIINKIQWSELDCQAAWEALKKAWKEGLPDRLAADINYYDVTLAAYYCGVKSLIMGSLEDRSKQVTRLPSWKGILCRSRIIIKGQPDGFISNDYIRQRLVEIANRLKFVNIFCRDWKETLKIAESELKEKFTAPFGVFLDPPYVAADAEVVTYSPSTTKSDLLKLRDELFQWCVEHGQIPNFRIVLTAYEEYDELRKHGWTIINFYKTATGYRNTAKNLERRNTMLTNRFRERLYLSPYCPKPPLVK